MQFHTKIIKKMYEILSMYDQAEIGLTPTMLGYFWQLNVPATAYYGTAQSTGQENAGQHHSLVACGSWLC
jgi:hypothetical protein